MMHHGLLTALGSASGRDPGEALLWLPGCARHSRHGGSVAVDLGKTIDMGLQVAAARPRLLILTHDDADHIGGWSGYKQYGLDGLAELWVPYEWGVLTQVLEDLELRGQDDTPVLGEDSLVAALKVVGERVPGSEPVDRHTEESNGASLKGIQERLTNSSILSAIGAALERNRPVGDESEAWRGSVDEVAVRAAKRGLRIAEILHGARAEGVGIRYFSVDHLPTNSRSVIWTRRIDYHYATIANAVELRISSRLNASVGTLASLLLLTIQNRRALCPVLWDCYSEVPAVLVWSDSSGDWTIDVERIRDLIQTVSVSTAPHHGSANKAHDPAWTALEPFLQSEGTVMIIAGGQHNQRVRDEYLQLSAFRRACTRCRHDPAEPMSHHVQVDVSCYGYARIRCGGCSG